MYRRAFLTTLGGLSLPSLLSAQYGKNAAAKNVIYLYLPGGIAAQEWLDPKPNAPTEYKGPFGTAKGKDTEIGGMFPLFAQHIHKGTIIRSMTHGEAAHERGTENMMTGYKPSPALSYPSMGSIISHELGNRNNLPAYVAIPNVANEFAGTGYLSNQFGPFGLGSDPASPSFKVRDLESSVEQNRFDRRRNLLETIDNKFKNSIEDDGVHSMEKFYSQAYDLISSQQAREAFDLEKEEGKVRDMYGRGQAGSRLLAARRLVESGVRLATVTYGGWDMHDNIKAGFERQGAELDKALAALMQDLEDRGMLEETIVLIGSEFGRTPKINQNAGRDHNPRVFSSFIAGGGIGTGVYGASSAISDSVDENPVSPADLFATVYNQLGIDPHKELMTPDLRPVSINRGDIITNLI